MSTQERSPRTRAEVAVISTVVVAVAAVFAVVAVTTGPGADTAGAAPTPEVTVSVPVTAAPLPSPQPTKVAELDDTLAVKKELVVEVTEMESVEGQGEGPGEIGGPSVRFTLAVANDTGATVNMDNTVVNAYYGAAATPAIQLQGPGGESFPDSVADGETVTGVFVFNVPTELRDDVQVTVDTSVKNAVLAFEGPAPQ